MENQNEILNIGLFEDLHIFADMNECYHYQAKKPVIIFYKAETEAENNTFQKIIQATKLKDDEIDLLQLVGDFKLNLVHVFESPICNTAIFIGLNNAEIGLPDFFQKNNAYKIKEKVFLISDSLAEMEKNPKLKTELWNQLKTIFNL